ncbi:GreA/GreB family elongation factor [bacterium]|nr:GreA/GreB family elongation factor [bacterium]
MAEQKKYYLTKEGLKEVKREYKKLVAIKKARAKEEMFPSIHSDELTAEFLNHQENLELLSAKIQNLRDILDNFKIIKPPPFSKRNTVCLGAKVRVEIKGKINEFVIVGSVEANPEQGKISNESPAGKALLGHKVGDEVAIDLPGKLSYKIKGIRYPKLN